VKRPSDKVLIKTSRFRVCAFVLRATVLTRTRLVCRSNDICNSQQIQLVGRRRKYIICAHSTRRCRATTNIAAAWRRSRLFIVPDSRCKRTGAVRCLRVADHLCVALHLSVCLLCTLHNENEQIKIDRKYTSRATFKLRGAEKFVAARLSSIGATSVTAAQSSLTVCNKLEFRKYVRSCFQLSIENMRRSVAVT